MHPNPMYHIGSRQECLDFASEIGFGALAVSIPNHAPELAHVPFVIGADGIVELHLMRSNPVARAARAGMPARLAIQGPHGYISPDWYGLEDQVPTWNYVAVHLSGQLKALPDDRLPAMLERLSDNFEQRLLPKPVWKLEKVSQEPLARMLRIIQPFALHIEDVDGTWKLAQHKPDAARLSAADGMQAGGIGSEVALLSEMMRGAKAI